MPLAYTADSPSFILKEGTDMSQKPQCPLTSANGAPVADDQNSITVGERGPLTFDNWRAFEKLAHFNRKRIPERVVHARGTGAYGSFTLSKDMSDYTIAKFLQGVGKKTDLFLRFSTVGGGQDSSDFARDPRGFAVKFYTEEGNWDMVGNNTPVFFLRDGIKFRILFTCKRKIPLPICRIPPQPMSFGRTARSRCTKSRS